MQKPHWIWMGLNLNVSETLAIFERVLEENDTILGT